MKTQLQLINIIIIIKVNKLSCHNSWIMSGIWTSCQHKTVLCMKLRNNKNPVLMKYFKGYWWIFSKVTKEAKRVEYDRHILKSYNLMRPSWKLINKELGKERKNHEFHLLNISGRSTTNHQIIANVFNKQFKSILLWLVKIFMQVTVLLKPLLIIRIIFPSLGTMYSKSHFVGLSTTVPPLSKLRI